MPFNPLEPADLVRDEIAQLTTSGYLLERVLTPDQMADVYGHDPGRETAARIMAEIRHAPRGVSWHYAEPDDLASILAESATTDDERTSLPADYRHRVRGAWTGRVAGCMLGKPIEDGVNWTWQRIEQYLQLTNSLPLVDYIPALEPMPAGYKFTPSWGQTTRGRVAGSARDDDIDYTILNLQLLETYGLDFETEHVAAFWLTYLPVLQIFTAERAAYRNLVNGLRPPATAGWDNPYREWIGAQIRADIFGYVLPGRPRAAAMLAYRDATLSHTANGIYGAMWAAALVSLAFDSSSTSECLLRSVHHIPARSRLAAALQEVIALHAAGQSWRQCRARLDELFGHYAWVHTIGNACVVAAALLWGDDDGARTLELTIRAGWDTDSNGATVGSIIGAVHGAAAIPAALTEPIGDHVRTAVFGANPASLSDLIDRTVALGRRQAEDHEGRR
jgi:ADP-ribosylglycohydrolase